MLFNHTVFILFGILMFSGDREGHVGDKLQTHQVAEREKEVKSLQNKLEAVHKEVCIN